MKFNKRKEKRRKGAQGLYQVEDYSWTNLKEQHYKIVHWVLDFLHPKVQRPKVDS